MFKSSEASDVRESQKSALISKINLIRELRVITKNAVVSAIQFPEKSSLRHMVPTEATRKRGS